MKTMFETWSTSALIAVARETRIDGYGQRGLVMGGPPSGIDGLHDIIHELANRLADVTTARVIDAEMKLAAVRVAIRTTYDADRNSDPYRIYDVAMDAVAKAIGEGRG